MRLKAFALLAGLTLAAGLSAVAPAEAQRAPYGAERYAEPGSASGRNVPGKFEYYALVLSWSPTHCAEVTDHRDDMQCARRDGRRYAFVLHGLWPQYENGFPESCPMRTRNYVPRPVIDDMLDIMPAPGLVIHEYKKHGTCSGLDAKNYFALARRLHGSIKLPQMLVNPFEAQQLTPDEIERAFLAANPELKPDMIAVACSGGQNARLKEVHICFSKEGQPRSCGRNEEQRRLCKAPKVTVPPVRSTKR